jgi:hypothetical protein
MQPLNEWKEGNVARPRQRSARKPPFPIVLATATGHVSTIAQNRRREDQDEQTKADGQSRFMEFLPRTKVTTTMRTNMASLKSSLVVRVVDE